MVMCFIYAVQTGSTSQVWLLSSQYVASETEEVNF